MIEARLRVRSNMYCCIFICSVSAMWQKKTKWKDKKRQKVEEEHKDSTKAAGERECRSKRQRSSPLGKMGGNEETNFSLCLAWRSRVCTPPMQLESQFCEMICKTNFAAGCCAATLSVQRWADPKNLSFRNDFGSTVALNHCFCLSQSSSKASATRCWQWEFWSIFIYKNAYN